MCILFCFIVFLFSRVFFCFSCVRFFYYGQRQVRQESVGAAPEVPVTHIQQLSRLLHQQDTVNRTHSAFFPCGSESKPVSNSARSLSEIVKTLIGHNPTMHSTLNWNCCTCYSMANQMLHRIPCPIDLSLHSIKHNIQQFWDLVSLRCEYQFAAQDPRIPFQ